MYNWNLIHFNVPYIIVIKYIFTPLIFNKILLQIKNYFYDLKWQHICTHIIYEVFLYLLEFCPQNL